MLGETLGPYRILGKLGEGGMGEVYRARDTKLSREVAIKVLPAALAQDTERVGRFRREAQILATLNHPNIAAIYGLEESHGTVGLVMELVAGEDLAERLRRGAIPVDEGIAIATQIAEALEAAHEKAIVHRDLKPANVKLTPDGKVKVLDFGLAKALEGEMTDSASGQLSHSPTMSRHATEAGLILGTAAYMSPEQARGRSVDKRADIWAFGVVLFEMLSGHQLFTGETVSDVLAGVLTREPDWSALPQRLPPATRQLLRRCLERDPRRRLRDIGDARPLLDSEESEGTSAPRAPSRSPWAMAAPWIVAVAAVGTALFVAATAGRPPGRASTLAVRFEVTAPGNLPASEPVMSNAGRFLVYATDRLYLRELSEFESRELPGTVHATQPFLSPDGKWLGFYADGKIKKLALAGGEPLAVTDAVENSPGAAFVTGDRILFSRSWNDSPLLSVSTDTGAVTPASTLDHSANERGHWWPRPLPDGRHVLFTIWYADAGLQASRVGVLDLETGRHRVLFPGAMAQYAAGRLLYYRAGHYHVVRFDAATLEFSGEPQPVLPDALGLDPRGTSVDPLSVAGTGTVAYRPGELNPSKTLTWIGRDGRRVPTSLTFAINGAALSPDDRRVAVGRPLDGASHLWVYDFAGGEQRLAGRGSNWDPVWHPDGRRLAYVSLRKGDFDVSTQALDGTENVAFQQDVDQEVKDWLPDGRMVVKEWLPDGTTTLLLARPGGEEPRALLSFGSQTDGGRVSPDGRWLAVCANPTGRFFVYVRSISGAGGAKQLAAADSDACGAHWTASTQELVFLRGQSVVALAWEERAGELVVRRETVFATVPPGTTLYGVSRDGHRVLVGTPSRPHSATPGIRVVVDGLPALSQTARTP